MRTASEALQEHGVTGEQLLKLSRKAATDALRRKGAFLDQHRYEELADYLLEVGVRCAATFETGHGIGMTTFLYRRMRVRYTDWLRLTLGDSRTRDRGGVSTRHPPGGRLFSCDEVRDTACYEEMPLDAFADELDAGDAWTVEHLAGPIALGWRLTEAAVAAGITLPQAKLSLGFAPGRSRGPLSPTISRLNSLMMNSLCAVMSCWSFASIASFCPIEYAGA